MSLGIKKSLLNDNYKSKNISIVYTGWLTEEYKKEVQ